MQQLTHMHLQNADACLGALKPGIFLLSPPSHFLTSAHPLLFACKFATMLQARPFCHTPLPSLHNYHLRLQMHFSARVGLTISSSHPIPIFICKMQIKNELCPPSNCRNAVCTLRSSPGRAAFLGYPHPSASQPLPLSPRLSPLALCSPQLTARVASCGLPLLALEIHRGGAPPRSLATTSSLLPSGSIRISTARWSPDPLTSPEPDMSSWKLKKPQREAPRPRRAAPGPPPRPPPPPPPRIPRLDLHSDATRPDLVAPLVAFYDPSASSTSLAASTSAASVVWTSPWAHYLGGYKDRLLGGSLGLLGLCHTAPVGVGRKDYGGDVLG
jgi:hypothetical protein